jgi:hypothetical protein
MGTLIALLIWIVIFAIVAYGLLWVCSRFFPEFPPARWICGGILLIILLIAIGNQYSGGGFTIPPLHR